MSKEARSGSTFDSFLWIADSRDFWASRMSSSRILGERKHSGRMAEYGGCGITNPAAI